MRGAASSVRDGICGICPAGCWIRARFEGERMVEVDALPDHPLGDICAIGRRSPDIVHDPDRLQTPLRRVGPRGSGEFEPISWDEALDLVVAGLRRLKEAHGPESTAIYTGRGSFDMALCDLFQPADAAISSASSLLFPFGSPNTLGVGALCYVSFAMIAPHVTLGEMYQTMEADLEGAELVVIWGANPATDSPPWAHRRILEAHARGARVISIDPRYHGTAEEVGAEWVAVRPGTDGALALGLLQVLWEEELLDEEFARRWTTGFEPLLDLVQHYRPEVVEGICGVPAAKVRELAREIAAARGAAPVMYTGLEYSDSGVQAIRAVFILWALAGQLDVPGGLTIRMRGSMFPQNRRHLLPNPDMRRALGRERFPVYSRYRGESHAIALPASVLQGEPYRVRGLLVLGGSLITAWPDPDLWRATLSALDLLVVIDRYRTADSDYADVILPATTYYENTSYMRYGGMFRIRERMLEPQGEARSDLDILAALAGRLGYGHLFPAGEEDAIRQALEGTPWSPEDVRGAGGHVRIPGEMMQYRKWEKGLLRNDGRPGFATPSGLLEIASTVLEEHGHDPLPVYTEPREGPLAAPELARRFPLVLGSGTRTLWDFRSQHHGVRGLAEMQPEPPVIMHVDDAAERGISAGDAVWVRSARGQAPFVARLTEKMVRGVVDAAMGGGGPMGPRAWRECNVNALTDPEHFDPISGFPVYKTLLCDVEPMAAEEARAWRAGSLEQAAVPRPEQSLRITHGEAALPPVDLDRNATGGVLAEVRGAMLRHLGEGGGGNPSSIHNGGRGARRAVDEARRRIAHVIGCTARRLVFTGSGSEANNLAILGLVRARGGGGHVITSAVEHPSVLEPVRALERGGCSATVLPVDSVGRVSPATLASAIRPDTLLVSVQLANNEVGTIQDIPALAAVAHRAGVALHVDAIQALGRIPIDVEALGADLLSISAHKVCGPQGVGALFVRRGLELEPLVYGGGQEWGLRSGTENVPGIAGFAEACELASARLARGDLRRVERLRDTLEGGVVERISSSSRNGCLSRRLPNTSSLTLPGIRGESLVLQMSRHGVRLSAGSACKSGNPGPSQVLLALGLTEEGAHCTVRLSLGVDPTPAEVERALDALDRVLAETRDAVRFVSCR